jgi:3-isopropylmalate/(R)-2-methylmalate dehydratase large subunit
MTGERPPQRRSDGQTLVQKLIARASGQAHATIGDIAVCTVDLAFAHDSSGPRRWAPKLAELGLGLWDPSRVVIVSDHYVPAVDAESAAILQQTRLFARDHEVGHFFDMQGISHTLLPQHGLLKPGMFVAGGDSHSCHGGAFGCYIAGYGATDMAAIVATGQTWVTVPETERVVLDGALPLGVTSKDIMVYLCGLLGMDNGFKAVEFTGSTVAAMSMDERMVLSNMSAELGFDVGLIAPDQTTLAHIRAHGGQVDDGALDWAGDEDAPYAREHLIDCSTLAPHVAAPHSPANACPVTAHQGLRIDQAYIGACVGAKLSDLHMAASVLAGRTVAETVRLLVAPASSRVTEQAAADGTLGVLLAAGARLMPSGCGACAGMGAGLLAAGEVCISTTNRNFKGRMGSAEADVWLASAYTVAASAVTGKITDPRGYLSDCDHWRGAA